MTLRLPGRQQHLLEQVVKAAAGKPVVLVLLTGSALALTWADEHCPAILQAFYPGADLTVRGDVLETLAPEAIASATLVETDDEAV